MELISVIIPVYNAKHYLKKCIESVLAQTYKNIELILVDDGSIDGSQNICDEYMKVDYRIKVIHKKNGGAAAARNTGLDISNGDYIYFVDCDDYIDSHALEIMLNSLNKNNADMVVSDYLFVNESGKIILNEDNTIRWSDCVMSGHQFLAQNCVERQKNASNVWNKLYRRKIFEHLRFEENKLHEDTQLFHLVCAQCKRVAVVGEVLYFYTKRANSIMGNYDYSRGVDVFESYLKRIIYMDKTGEPELQSAIKNVINMFFYIAFLYSAELGFDDNNLNSQMKSVRKEVYSFLPIFLKDRSRSMKERIACSIWLLSPRIYGGIWGNRNNGTK